MTAAVVRPAAVAGRFYPADPEELRRVVEVAVADAGRNQLEEAAAPKALVAPHAGYVYSGPVAASAYARAAPLRG
ncbi:MAG TPA: AmmeMemoRadiSam system protein B, partial [Acidimicrobiia bacterium]